LKVELLYHDTIIVAAGAHSKLGTPPQNRSRRAGRGAVDRGGAHFVGACVRRRNFPGPRPQPAQDDGNDGLRNPSGPFGRRWPVPRNVRDPRAPAVDCRQLRPHGAAG
jgi:hypothetical protein